ncbi:MAG: hypothetical protein HQK55_09535 [Deltaproteobacteria bacterium]|nr:hypothetical protein [Deltaproteobacteria bacterium]
MNYKIAMAFLIAVCFSADPIEGLAETPNLSGVWESSVMFSDIVAQVEQNGETISGVVYIHGAYGKIITYHISGTVKDGFISAAHYQGHRFLGQLQPDGQVSGRIITASGKSVALIAHRRKSP